MTDVKTPRRPSRSRKRQLQAAETREAVLTAAKTLFLATGWAKTTIAVVADKAGVSKETVYAVFGNKKTLLRQVILAAVRGDDPETPLIQQTKARHIAEIPDQAQQIELFVADITKVLARVAPLMDVVRTAAAAEPAMAALYNDLHKGRRENLEWFAKVLLCNGSLRGELDAQAAGTVLWRLASPDLYLLVRRIEGASDQTYATWLTATLKQQLLNI